MTPELESEYRQGLEDALRAGWEILDRGGASLDAVEAAVSSLEDFHLFNAGRGSVFTHEGKNEMDACIMDGAALRAGAVAAVKNIKNPVRLARLVMERTEHIMLVGEGANHFALLNGVESVDDAYFFTEHRYEQLLKARAAGTIEMDHTAEEQELVREEKPAADKARGTVGAVACDTEGRLAAATSTGGMTNKKFGRVGDTSIVGLGTFANDLCAVSCTGHGEYFMIGVTAYDVAARMRYKGVDLATAARETLEFQTKIGGEGGLIAVDAVGNLTLPFNSDGMYRGCVKPDGEIEIGIYSS
jgi:beta-aspartyl-peptidase (threonine type)